MDTPAVVETFEGRCPICWHGCIWTLTEDGKTVRAEFYRDGLHADVCTLLLPARNELPQPTYAESTPPWLRESRAQQAKAFRGATVSARRPRRQSRTGPDTSRRPGSFAKLACGHWFKLSPRSRQARTHRRCRECHQSCRVLAVAEQPSQ